MRLPIALAATLIATPALAHHPLGGLPMETFAHGLLSGLGHPVLGFDHLLFVVAAGIAAALAGVRLLGPAAYVVAMLAGCALMAAGLGLPAKEAAIALSLLVVGGLVASGRSVGTAATLVLLAAFGLFHGSAFGDAIAAQEGRRERHGARRLPPRARRAAIRRGRGGRLRRHAPVAADARAAARRRDGGGRGPAAGARGRRRAGVRGPGAGLVAPIPATVVTGFLGAGKTTLIRHLLAQADGRRIALIVNEFGDLGVDGETLRGCNDAACADEDIVELSNGCICCTVAEDFVPTIEALLARPAPPDHIVIETSGLALPQPLVRAFAWPAIRGRVTVDGVVAVVDAPAVAEGRFAHDPTAVDAQRRADEGLDHETPLAELYEDQIACADLIVVNKADLLDDAEGAALAERITQEARPGTAVLRAREGRLPIDVLLGRAMAAEDDPAREEVHHHHHDDEEEDHDDHGHDAFESFVLERAAIEDPRAFAAALSAAMRAHGVLRVKGFAKVAGKPMRLAIQAVGPRVDHRYDRPLAEGDPEGTRLVVIGQAGLDRAAIEAALA